MNYAILLVILVGLAPGAWAAAPNLLTYQGRLKEAGSPVTGTRQVNIYLCDAESGGTCTGTGEQPVAVTNALFKTTFTVPAGVDLTTGNWYLEVRLGAGGTTTLAPRERLSSSPYAVVATSATTLAADSGQTGATVSTSVFVLGRLGVGTANPQAQLEVSSSNVGGFLEALKLKNADVTSQASSVGLIFENAYVGAPLAKIRGYVGSPGNNGGALDLMLRNGSDATYSSPLTLSTLNEDLGRVGIGTTTPNYKLHVNGSLGAKRLSVGVAADAGFNDGSTLYLGSDFNDPNNWTGSNAGYRLFSNRQGVLVLSNAGGGSGWTLESTDATMADRTAGIRSDGGAYFARNVGVGTSAPTARLHVSSPNATGSDTVLKASSGTGVGQELLTVKGDGKLGIATSTITVSGTDMFLVPAGAVMMFNLASCPGGWSELTAARGRYLVGLPLSGSLAGTAGTALTNLENRPVGQHNHSVTDPGHTHSISHAATGGGSVGLGGGSSSAAGVTGSGNTGLTIDNSGSVAGTNAPYIQLLVCKKD